MVNGESMRSPDRSWNLDRHIFFAGAFFFFFFLFAGGKSELELPGVSCEGILLIPPIWQWVKTNGNHFGTHFGLF